MEVRDGQGRGEGQEGTHIIPHLRSPSHLDRQASWGHQDPEKDPIPTKAWPKFLQDDEATVQGGSHGRREEHRVSARSIGHSISLATSERESFLQNIYEGRRQREHDAKGIKERKEEAITGRPSSGVKKISNRETTGHLSDWRKMKAKRMLMSTPEEKNLNEDIGRSRRHDREVFTVPSQPPSLWDNEGVGGEEHQNSRVFSTSYLSRTATRGLPADHQEHRKQNWKTWSHNLDLHVKDESDFTSQFIHDIKNKRVTAQHDPPAEAARNDHLGTTSHDFQMRKVRASRNLCLERYQTHNAHVETLQQDQSQGDPHQGGRREKRQPQAGRRKVFPAMKSVPSGVSESSLRAMDGSQLPFLPLSSDFDHPPHPPATVISDYKAEVKEEGFHGSLFSPRTERGSLTVGNTDQRSESSENIPTSHRKQEQDTFFNGHKFRFAKTKVTREASQEDLTPTSLKEDSCEEVRMFGRNLFKTEGGGGSQGSRVHVVETVVTVVVKDINDNAPVFPNTTMLGHVQENGPTGEYCPCVIVCRLCEGCCLYSNVS